MATTATRTCRSTSHDNGIPWKCDRPHGHTGKHQVHYQGSRTVIKTWDRK